MAQDEGRQGRWYVHEEHEEHENMREFLGIIAHCRHSIATLHMLFHGVIPHLRPEKSVILKSKVNNNPHNSLR
jgi:hypothetical protein